MVSLYKKKYWQDDIIEICSQDLPWENLSGTTIIVTGAGGFLGGYITRVLLSLHDLGFISKPIKVIALVRNIQKAKIIFFEFANDSNLSFLKWDLNSIGNLSDIDCNYILHTASQASPVYYGKDPVGTLLPNTVGTAALLELLKKSKEPRGFLFVSSSEIYGQSKDRTKLTEEDYGIIDPINIRSCYSESKRMGENMCAAWQEQYKLPCYIVRPFHTYGLGLQENDGRVFADLAFNVINGQNIRLNSNGSAKRAFCYATDAILGFFCVLLKGKPMQPYNVANPSGEMSILELANLLVSLYPSKKLNVQQKKAENKMGYIASPNAEILPNINKLLDLGWRSKVSPTQGFSRMIEGIEI